MKGGMISTLVLFAICLTTGAAAEIGQGATDPAGPGEAKIRLMKGTSRPKAAPTKYKVVGLYQTEKGNIGTYAVAKLTEQVEFEFFWPSDKAHLPRPLPNVPTKVEQVRNPSGSCPLPVLKGPYEHFALQAVEDLASMLTLRGERRIPDAEVSEMGEGGCRTRSLRGETREEVMTLVLPMELFTGQAGATQVLKTSDQGWTWTFTPVQ